MVIVNKIRRWFILWLHQFTIHTIKNNRCEDNDIALVIKLDAIGDFIIWLDSAKEYRHLYPNKKIVLLCNSVCKELAESTNYFDEILVLNINKYESDKYYRDEQDREISKLRFGILVQTAYSRTQHMDRIAATIFANRKIGFVADESKSNFSRWIIFKRNKKKLDQIYDQLIPSSNENLMELQRNKEFIIGLGSKNFKSAIPKLPIISGVNIPQANYFIVFPGASTKTKRWRTEWYGELIDYVHHFVDWNCLVCGSREEEYLYSIIRNSVSNKTLVKNYCGRVSLLELIEVVRKAKFVLSNDTSGIHFAESTKVVGICPFGEYNFGRFLPYVSDSGCGTSFICSANVKCRNCSNKTMKLSCIFHVFKYGRYKCLDLIRPSDIKEILERVIRNEI